MKKIIKIIIIVLIIIIVIVFLSKKDITKTKSNVIPDLVGENIEIISKYKDILNITYNYDYNDKYDKNIIYKQSITKGSSYKKNDNLVLEVSLGKIDYEKLAQDSINELGKVPIMMYHGIIDKPNSETKYTGGNVDKDGYNRTVEAFKSDLEMYYQKGYRMIRLDDYINGNINVEYGKSPIIITFDDGNENNLKVDGQDASGNIIINKNSAVGVLEEFKKKYPDYNVTATFFVNGSLFNQEEYNEKILKWLVDNGYDVGNHTNTHVNISKIDSNKLQEELGSVYNKLENIIPGKYVHIVALPFGSPYKKEHENYPYILNGTYESNNYYTTSALRVGWEPEVSVFDNSFDKEFLKRCRAYDNDGKEFDIKMVFDNLESNKYISDGNNNSIVIKKEDKSKVNTSMNKKIIEY